MNAQDKAEQELHELIRTAVHTTLMATPMLEAVSETADRTATAVLAALHQRAHNAEKGGWLFVAQGAHRVSDYLRVHTNASFTEWEVFTEVAGE